MYLNIYMIFASIAYQLQYLELEGNFYERVHQLECEFMADFDKITAKVFN